MCDETLVTTSRITLTTGVMEMLGSNPRRKAFLLTPLAVGANGIISVSMRNPLVAGQGVLNYVVGLTFPTMIDDEVLGDSIHEPWFIISANGGEVVEIIEVSYRNVY